MEQHIYQTIHDKDKLFPFSTQFSLHKVIDHWQQKAKSKEPFIKEKAKLLLEQLENFPALKQPVQHPEEYQGDKSILQHLFSDVYAVDFQEDEALSINTPFIFEHLYHTEKFAHIMRNIDPEDEKFQLYLERRILISRLTHAYNFIFEKLFQLKLQETDIPLVIPFRNPENGLVRYYTEELYTQFIDIHAEDFPPLTDDQIDALVSNYANTELWSKYLPPEKLTFSGVGLLKLIDITERESLTRLQTILLEDSLITEKTIHRLERILSNFLELPKLNIGLIAYDDYLDLYKIDRNIWSSALIKSGVNFSHKKLKKLFSDKLKSTEDILHINIKESDFFSDKVTSKLTKAGIQSIMLAPLFKNGGLFGILEISSTVQNNMRFSANKLSNVLPLFELAVERSLETVNNKVQTIIKNNCTAIHPSVEWKFLKLALRAYRNGSFQNANPRMDEIKFKQVYPIFGNIDIRNSTVTRNKTVYEDLELQLSLALEAINGLLKKSRLRILEHLKFNLEEKLEEHQNFPGVQDSDDTYNFLEKEVNPIFIQLSKDKRIDQNWVAFYNNRIDPKVGILYEKRKDFELSVSQINSIISKQLDQEQKTAQNIYPHYFEKFITDGVDFTVFIGSDISPKIQFSEVYVRNMRLWQFETMAKISLQLEQNISQLRTPLNTAQLIYVQGTPLDIKFRYEEKRFDVDGTFNARFEIVKKRLDKATILGKQERLTQPGKISIVYSQNTILSEYLDYIDYLQHKKLLTNEIEFLELEDLQGADGLKAIRVKLNVTTNEASSDAKTKYKTQKAE